MRHSTLTSPATRKPYWSTWPLAISIPLCRRNIVTLHTLCLPSSQCCQNFIAIQLPMSEPEGYEPAGIGWYHQESAGPSHMVSQWRSYQFRSSVALVWQHDMLLLANSHVMASRSHRACQPYGREVWCWPYVSNLEGRTGVTYSSTRLGIPPLEFSGLQTEMSGVPECQIC